MQNKQTNKIISEIKQDNKNSNLLNIIVWEKKEKEVFQKFYN